jgi:hypothetical protein
MKSKIFKTIGVIILIITIWLVYNLLVYGTGQEYAQTAAQQFSDDSSYFVLRTQTTILTLCKVLYVALNLGSLSLFYFIWKPKKVEEVK